MRYFRLLFKACMRYFSACVPDFKPDSRWIFSSMRKDVGSGKFHKVIEDCKNLLELKIDRREIDILIVIESRLTQCIADKLKRCRHEGELDIEFNRIASDLLELVTEIEKNH